MRIDARLGQQSGLLTNEFANETPRSISKRSTCGIDHSVSQRWSSVTIRSTDGRSLYARAGAGMNVTAVASSAIGARNVRRGEDVCRMASRSLPGRFVWRKLFVR